MLTTLQFTSDRGSATIYLVPMESQTPTPQYGLTKVEIQSKNWTLMGRT